MGIWSLLTTPLRKRDRRIAKLMERMQLRFWKTFQDGDAVGATIVGQRLEDLAERFPDKIETFDLPLVLFVRGENGRFLRRMGWPHRYRMGYWLFDLAVAIALCNLGRGDEAVRLPGEHCEQLVRHVISGRPLPDDAHWMFCYLRT